MSSSSSGAVWLNNSSRMDAFSAMSFRLAGGGGDRGSSGKGVEVDMGLLEEPLRGSPGWGLVLGGFARRAAGVAER